MDIVYYNEDFPDAVTKSIFLAGPSVRSGQDIESWRKDAIQILDDIGFDGTVYIPEFRDPEDKKSFSYSKAVEWEDKFLNAADCIVFWVPRSKDLPGFTTNVEWGRWECTGKVVLGFPKDAEKMSYLEYYANKYHAPVEHTLTATLEQALEMLGDGAERTGGERYVQLSVWKTKSFQNWYEAQTNAGNKLLSAKLFWLFKPNSKAKVFLWVVKVAVYIASEDRVKNNEFVLSRTDISTVLLWKKNLPLEQSEIVIVKEFRSPANTEDGFIREMPGGSSPSEGDATETAAEEIHEETGFYLDPARLKEHGARQLMGTLSAHKAHFYSARITEEEMDYFKSQKGVAHGNEEDSERTFIEVYTIRDLLNKKIEVDWSTMGQILFLYCKAWETLNEED